MPEQALVGLIMGSKSDWETLQHCGAMLDQLKIPVRSTCPFGSSYAGLIVRICFVCGIARPGSNYRRCRRCSASGGNRGGKDIAPRAGRSDGIEIIERDGFSSLDGTDAGGDSRRNACDRESGSNKRSLVRCGDHVRKASGVSRSNQAVS